MKNNPAKTTIIHTTREIIAHQGFENFSIRKLATQVSLAPSVIYHYFPNEQALFKTMFDQTSRELGQKRAQLTPQKNASDMLKQRIEFQIDNADMIVAVIKYYLTHRDQFTQNTTGFLPEKSTLHIVEVLEFGKQTGEFHITDLTNDAQVITHAINGFLLEYFPHQPTGKTKKQLIDKIHNFVLRALKGGENI